MGRNRVLPPLKQIMKKLAVSLIVAVLIAVGSASAQEVADIPFFSSSPGAPDLGGGLRFGESPYFATDNEDQR
jgi:hypothetical protein